MSYRDLSARLEEIGRPIPPLGLSRIEKGERRVDADDLVALALVLNVSPAALLMPEESDSRTTCYLTDEVPAKATDAWKWATGEATLPELWEPRDPQRQEDYERLSVPTVLRHIKQTAAGRIVDSLQADIYRLVLELANHSSDSAEEDEQFKDALAMTREAVSLLTHEINRIETRRAQLTEELRERRAAREREGNGQGLD
jgi:transcriptional regulator with XRE-family HTH domain